MHMLDKANTDRPLHRRHLSGVPERTVGIMRLTRPPTPTKTEDRTAK